MGKIYFTTDYFHLNFKLSRAGESIGLYDPDGIAVDSVHFGLQFRDVSMGRKPDGSDNWMYFSEPTPQASNSTEGTLNLQYAANPDVSPESGFYTGTLAVTVSSDSGDSLIKYTLDGSKPISSSESCNASINIDTSTVIRTRVFEEDKLASSTVSRTYFINEDISLSVVSIITPPEALWDDQYGIYDNRMKGREIPVTLELFSSDNKKEFSINAGLRLCGQASLFYPQVSFTLYSRERYGTDEINYQVFPQRELKSYKALYLRNSGVPDNRSTFFRDALQHTLVINKIDIDCQAYLPSVVFLNGIYWGIYNIRDKINEDYIASVHNLDPADIDLLEYESGEIPVVMSGNADNYNLFYEYVETNDLSLEENYRFVETWMDVDEFINYQICEIYYDNVFWPNQNMRMWRERKEDGKWRWILFDTDYGFGMPNECSSGYSNNTLDFATSSCTGSVAAPEWSTLILRKLLQNEEFRILFIQRFAGYMNSVFHPDTVVSVINKLQDDLSPEMPRHIQRWKDGEWYYGDPIPDISSWESQVELMKDFARNRPDYQRQHIIDYFDLSGSSVLTVNIEEPGMGQVLINGTAISDSNASGIYFRDIPVDLKAIPKVGYSFVRWEGIEMDAPDTVSILLHGDSLSLTAVFDTVPTNTIPLHITSDTVLTGNNSPWYATADIIVDSNTVLTIENGVEIMMPEEADILVYGKILIEGTPGDPVIIAPNQYSDHWGALCLVNSSDSSIISNLVIISATRGRDFDRDRAAISGNNADFSLHKIRLENVKFPVFVQYGKVLIDSCTLHTDEVGDIINIKYAESAVVENCNLRGNDSYDSDAIDYDGISNGIIRGNRIYNFYGTNSDAIDLGEGSQDILIGNNIIYNIDDKGVSIGGGSTASISRNIIANCGQGAGIKDNGSYGYFEHNNFYANQYGIACFEKNIGKGGGQADVVNCIFAGSRNFSVYTDEFSKTDVSFSISNTDVPEGMHNLSGDPLFLNNLYLAENSPAINSGNPSLPADPDGSAPDMGVYPYDQQKQVNLVINEIHYNPVEGGNNKFVELVNTGSSSISINGFQIKGNIDLSFPDDIIAPGEIFLIARDMSVYQGQGYRVYQWDSGDLPDGPGSILLLDSLGNTLDFVDYDSRYWWPSAPDGQGPSLELHNTFLENMVSSSWRGSYIDGGTPGKASSSVEISGIYINEFSSSNAIVIADENEEYDDWIEFYNSTDKAVNLGGLYITDNLDIPYKFQIPIHASGLTTIPAGGFILFWADGQADQGVLHLGFKLDAAGEQIGLVQKSGDSTLFIDSLSFAGQTTDISMGRFADGSGSWYDLNVPTPGLSNVMTGVQYQEHLPEEITLYQNYPNPFRSATIISYQLSTASEVELSVYDLLGRRVTTLIKEWQQAGSHKVEWKAEGMKPGIYLYEIRSLQGSRVNKMFLIQ